ncbi:MAG: hypothetical protein PHQ60_07370 [Sideroxydans sp.]|nr:hypothetical protein [Sideroxydans sp.]
MKRNIAADRQFLSGDLSNKGYKQIEASQFIEFCVELDSQDDRMPSSRTPTHDPDSPNYHPQINPALWNPVPVFDSREMVAKDVLKFMSTGETEENKGWVKLYREIIGRATNKERAAWKSWQDVFANPEFNGFGPYQGAWLLYEGRNENAGSYAIAIRGTVMSSSPSVTEDALFHPVVATHFLNPHVSFASFNGASLHSGFAHATFSLLLDDKYGILRALSDKHIPPDAPLFIVGHSQGASMTTLTHAFFHYAMKNATATSDPFRLYGKNFKLKSYGFAQPKPGNYEFAADFASITQGADNAIVINNDIDVVPQVPLTLQDLGDLDGDLPKTTLPVKLFHYVAGVGSGLHGLVGRIAEPFVRKSDAHYGYYFHYDELGKIGETDIVGSSWNFTPAGRVMLVYGAPGNTSDEFLQHHAWSYRNLIRQQLP